MWSADELFICRVLVQELATTEQQQQQQQSVKRSLTPTPAYNFRRCSKALEPSNETPPLSPVTPPFPPVPPTTPQKPSRKRKATTTTEILVTWEDVIGESVEVDQLAQQVKRPLREPLTYTFEADLSKEKCALSVPSFFLSD